MWDKGQAPNFQAVSEPQKHVYIYEDGKNMKRISKKAVITLSKLWKFYF